MLSELGDMVTKCVSGGRRQCECKDREEYKSGKLTFYNQLTAQVGHATTDMFVGELACPLCNFEFEQWADQGYAFTNRGIVHCRLPNLLSVSVAHYSESLDLRGYRRRDRFRCMCAIVVVRCGQSPV